MFGLTLALIACRGEQKSADSGAPAETADTGSAPVAELPDPSWTADQVGDVMNVPLSQGLPDPTSLLSAFQAMFVGADADCPTLDGDYSMTLYVATCSSDLGWTYQGVSGLEPGAGADFWLMGDCFIADANGDRYTCAGELERETTEDGFELKMTGIWGYTASTVPWIANVPSLALWESKDAEGIHLNGSYGPGETYMYFDEVTVAESCPTGAVWLRDPAGSWYILTLGESCDGCGEVTYGDEALGEACINIAGPAEALAARME